MSLKASFQLLFRATGVSQAQKALRGITDTAKKGAEDSKKANEAAAKYANTGAANQINSLKRTADAAKRAASGQTRAAQGAASASQQATAESENAKRSEYARTENAARNAASGSARAWTRAASEARKAFGNGRAPGGTFPGGSPSTREGAGGRFGRFAGGLAGAGATLGLTAIDQVRGFGSTLGVASREQMIQGAIAFDADFIRLANQAGLSGDRRDVLRNNIISASRQNMIAPEQVLAAMNTAQNRFSNLDFFARNVNQFAAVASALNTPMDDIVGAVGEFQRQMGVTAQEVPELIGMMAAAAQNGSIEFNDISQEFGTVIGNFARTTGAQGMEGARQFIGIAQTLGAGGASSAETATLAQNMLSRFADPRVLRRLQSKGVNVFEGEGPNRRFVGVDSVVAQMTQNQRFQGQGRAAALRAVFGEDMQANTAIGILMSETDKARREGRQNPIEALAASSASQGNAMIEATNRDLRGSTAGRAMQLQVDAQANFLRNGDQLIEHMTNMARPMMELETNFPVLAQAVDSTRDAFTNLVGVFAAFKLLGGGAAATAGAATAAGTAGTAGAAGAVGAGGAATAGAGAMGLLGSGAALAGAGAAGWGIGRLLNWSVGKLSRDGEDLDNLLGRKLAEWTGQGDWLSDPTQVSRPGSQVASAGPGGGASGTEVVRATQDQTRELTTELRRLNATMERSGRAAPAVGAHEPGAP